MRAEWASPAKMSGDLAGGKTRWKIHAAVTALVLHPVLLVRAEEEGHNQFQFVSWYTQHQSSH